MENGARGSLEQLHKDLTAYMQEERPEQPPFSWSPPATAAVWPWGRREPLRLHLEREPLHHRAPPAWNRRMVLQHRHGDDDFAKVLR